MRTREDRAKTTKYRRCSSNSTTFLIKLHFARCSLDFAMENEGKLEEEIEQLRAKVKEEEKAAEKLREDEFMASMETEEIRTKMEELEKELATFKEAATNSAPSNDDGKSSSDVERLQLENEALKEYLRSRAGTIVK